MNPVVLDAKMSSRLDFKEGRTEALLKIGKGEPLFFELDFGLKSGLKYPLGTEMETRALLIAIEHFFNTLWEEFKTYVKGVYLYRGPILYEETLFSEFMKCLTEKMSASVPLFLDFESSGHKPLEVLRKTSRTLFSRFTVLVDGKVPPFRSFDSPVGFLLPNTQDSCFDELIRKGIEPRVIEEAYLISEWNGLDYLLVDPLMLDNEAVRKLKGFAAAGGVVVTSGPLIGIPGEISFDREFLFPHL